MTPNSSRGRVGPVSEGLLHSTGFMLPLLYSAQKISREAGDGGGGGGSGERDRDQLWGGAWESNTHRPREAFREALSSSSSTHPMAPPHSGWGLEVHSSALLCGFAFRVPGGRRWGRQWGQLRKTLDSLVNRW